jgi:hypothetical protein
MSNRPEGLVLSRGGKRRVKEGLEVAEEKG